MTRALQEQWSGHRNIRIDNAPRASSVNMDTVSPQCVGWRYCVHGQDDHLGQEDGHALHQVDGGVTPDSLTSGTVSPPLHDVQGAHGADGGLDASLEWDDYVSDPSFVTGSTRASYRSFDVDDLVISSDATGSDVFELQRGEREVTPPLPPRALRSQSVIVCSAATCKPRRKRSQR